MSFPAQSAFHDVDALIVNYRVGHLTAKASAAIEGAANVYVWDNSGDCLPMPGARLFGDGTNTFYAAANNALFAKGNGRLVLLLNPDVVLTREVLGGMVARLDADPRAWGVTIRLVGTDAVTQNYLHSLPTTRALLADRLPPLRRVFRRAYRTYDCSDIDLGADGFVEQPPAAALLLRRAQVVAVGGLFDVAYPLFFNDVDLSRRMRRLGTCIYAASLTAEHVGGASIRAAGPEIAPVARLYDDGLLTYARRHLSGSGPLALAVHIRRAADMLRRSTW